MAWAGTAVGHHHLVRRAWMLFGWLAGTAAAVALGIEAVNVVTATVTDGERPAAMSPAMVSDALAEQSGAPVPGGTDTSSSTTASGPPATTATGPSTTRASSPATATTRPTAASGPTATTRATPTTATTVPATTPTTASPSGGATAPPEERTYDLVGGMVAIRFENGAARLLWATPKPGFRVERRDDGSGQVDVRFESDDHESRLRAWWEDGPQAEVDERAENGG